KAPDKLVHLLFGSAIQRRRYIYRISSFWQSPGTIIKTKKICLSTLIGQVIGVKVHLWIISYIYRYLKYLLFRKGLGFNVHQSSCKVCRQFCRKVLVGNNVINQVSRKY